MIKRIKFKQLILVLAGLSLLCSCGNTPNKKTETANTALNTQQSDSAEKTISPDEYLQRAADALTAQQATLWYVRAADAWLLQNNPANALAILTELDTELMSEFILAQYRLFKAEAYLAYFEHQQAFNQVKTLTTIQGFETRLFKAQSESASLSQHYLEAAKARIKLKAYLNDETLLSEQNNLIWRDLVHLHKTAYQHFQDPNEPELSGWLALLNITQTYADSPANMLLNIRHWQAQYPQHPAAQQLPADLQLALQSKPYRPTNIAVILPFSGKFIKQSEAIQQGIVAAYYENKLSYNPTITFIDSNSWDLAALKTADYDFIIGPLLKQNVDELIKAELSQPVLLLNEVADDVKLSDHQFNFALSPEKEAEQAARKMVELGYKKPIIFAANDSYGRRMGEAFIKEYKALTENTVEISFFSNTDEMEASVTQLMETEQSNARIKTIRQLFDRPKNFEADARNRRDIDAIYIIGDATQTRILKPYIDVNTSPFAPIIPIYASSRSYSSKLNNADLRDLNQIIFSDMPWILPGRADHNKLAYQMQLAWKNTNDELSRFFAFGFDAYSLIPNLSQMRVFPGFNHSGLTGLVSVEASGRLKREMKWAKFNNGQVINLAMQKQAK